MVAAKSRSEYYQPNKKTAYWLHFSLGRMQQKSQILSLLALQPMAKIICIMLGLTYGSDYNHIIFPASSTKQLGLRIIFK